MQSRNRLQVMHHRLQERGCKLSASFENGSISQGLLLQT